MLTAKPSDRGAGFGQSQDSLLDASAQVVFDRLTALATRVLRIPVALVTFLEPDQQVFRSRSVHDSPLEGVRATPLSHSLCQIVASTREPLVVPDTRVDERTRDNPVVSEYNVVAYAGLPLFDAAGQAIGAFCAIDHVPRAWSHEELDILRSLAAQVTGELALRASLDRLGLEFDALRKAEANRAEAGRADRHDLRTPLQAMLLGVQAVRHLGDLNPDQDECLSLAERNGQVLVAMVDKLLDIGRIEDQGRGALSYRACLPLEIVATAFEQVAALAADKRIVLRSTVLAVAALDADRDKIVRVLVNLLGNAVKFTPDGGEVSVEASPQDGGVRFSVCDNGVGITRANVTRLFREGYRVDENADTRRSTGLGLAFCKRVIEAHGGRIWVESEPGCGSTFLFTLPVRTVRA